MPSEFGEFEAPHRSGREFPVEITHWWIESEGEITFHAFIRDISERKTREQELALR